MDKTRDNGEIIKKLFLKRFGDQEYTFRMKGGDTWDEYDCHIVTIIFDISEKTKFWEYVKDTISSITFDDIIDYDFGVE